MESEFNYLFVSDFHIAIGQDPATQKYHPREDFLYDAEFFRFLQWADKNRENDGRFWELVFVGDCFDFLPVELTWYDEYQQFYDQLSLSLLQLQRNPERALEPWFSFFHLSTLPDDVKSDLLSHFVSHNLLKIEFVSRDEIQKFIRQNHDKAEEYAEDEFVDETFPSDEDPTFEDVAGDPEEPDAEYMPDEPYNPCWADWEWEYKTDDSEEMLRRGAYNYAEKNTAVLIPPRLIKAFSRHTDGEHTLQHKGCFTILKAVQTAPYRFVQFRYRKNARLADLQYRMLTEQKMSLEKMCYIYRGHQTFFKALAWWVARGHRLVILPGNHDLEIAWPQVHQRLKELIYYSYQENRQKWSNDPKIKSDAEESNPPANDKKSFLERIDYYGWFYYKKGVFFAQHGAQYDNLNGTINLLNPYQKRETDPDKKKLNPAFGSLGVATFVAHMEDQFPQWENEGSYSVTLTRLLKEHPWRTALLIGANVWSFARLSWYLFQDTGGFRINLDQQLPTRTEINAYGRRFELDESIVQQIYCSWDPPMFSLGWFRIAAIIGLNLLGVVFWVINWFLKAIKWLFHPKAGLVLMIALFLSLFLLPGVGDFIQEIIGIANRWQEGTLNQLLSVPFVVVIIGLAARALWSGFMEIKKQNMAKKNEKSFQLVFYHDYIFEGAKGVYDIFRNARSESIPRYYIMGHDHHPGRKRLGYSPSYEGYDFTFFNTGSWLPSFEDKGERRLRTGGLDNEFTFLKIWGEPEPTDPFVDSTVGYTAELLRWNDHAGRAENQISIEKQDEDPQPVHGFWSAVIAAICLLLGVLWESFWLGAILGIILGVVLAIGSWLLRSLREDKTLTVDGFGVEEPSGPGKTDCFAEEAG